MKEDILVTKDFICLEAEIAKNRITELKSQEELKRIEALKSKQLTEVKVFSQFLET